MATTEEHSPCEVYQFHILLLQISPAIWRRILIHSDNSIADLHHVLQIVMGWDDTHLHRFTLHGKEYGIAQLGGIWFRDDPNQIHLADLHLRLKERFLYEYDLIDSWQHQIRLEQKLPFDPTRTYPCKALRRARLRSWFLVPFRERSGGQDLNGHMLHGVPAAPSTNHYQQLSLPAPHRNDLARWTTHTRLTEEGLIPQSCLDLSQMR